MRIHRRKQQRGRGM